MNGWIGVDLDGTLAHYDYWRGVDHIGKPIKPMIKRVKKWLREGKQVRIFTARVYDKYSDSAVDWEAVLNTPEKLAERTHEQAERMRGLVAIQAWCKKHIGLILPITNEKDFGMIELWDDRCVQVEQNTGRRIGPDHEDEEREP